MPEYSTLRSNRPFCTAGESRYLPSSASGLEMEKLFFSRLFTLH